MNPRPTSLLLAACLLLLAACDLGAAPPTATPVSPGTQSTATPQASMALATQEQTGTAQRPPNGTPTAEFAPTATLQALPETPTALPAPAGVVTDTAAVTAPPTPDDSEPSPTPVTATSSGAELTAVQALEQLKPRALAWQKDAGLAMLANVRPGQGAKMLGTALGDPDIFEPTPGGKGRNWTLLAGSRSAQGAMSFSMDGTQADLVAQGELGGVALDRFLAEMAVVDLSRFAPTSIKNSDEIMQQAGERGRWENASLALLIPDGLGSPPSLAYELFSTDPARQTFIFFDAPTGRLLMDSE